MMKAQEGARYTYFELNKRVIEDVRFGIYFDCLAQTRKWKK